MMPAEDDCASPAQADPAISEQSLKQMSSDDDDVITFQSTASGSDDYHFTPTGPSSAFLLALAAACGAVLAIASVEYGLEAMIDSQTLPPPPALDRYVALDQQA